MTEKLYKRLTLGPVILCLFLKMFQFRTIYYWNRPDQNVWDPDCGLTYALAFIIGLPYATVLVAVMFFFIMLLIYRYHSRFYPDVPYPVGFNNPLPFRHKIMLVFFVVFSLIAIGIRNLRDHPSLTFNDVLRIVTVPGSEIF